MNIKEKLLNGNKEFVLSLKKDESKHQLLKGLQNGQHPYALIITCSDSRVVPEEMFSTSFGELFVIRTAGNVINEDELATIEYGIEHLYIKYVLVLGHTSCGAVHAAIHNEKGKYLDPILNKIKINILNIDNEREASIKNAEEVANYIQKMFPDYDGIIESGLYDLLTNKVTVC